ncbi:MarR family transcriptional regulator [Cetobacterium sp.]|uniref:MarR family transcriptional regulator n=1 Tax=Cetobacterium sp. TaxID=2071632 RepID=UPI003EE63A9C
MINKKLYIGINFIKMRDKILEKINESPGLTLTELAEEFLKSKASITFHLKKLEKEDLIKKYIVRDNKKYIRLHPTKKGKDRYLELKRYKITENKK